MTNEKQHRIGLIGAISFVIGNSIGSGLFITPTAILQQTNSIELGTSIRKSGSDFAYLCHVKWSDSLSIDYKLFS
ncbi:hypothetical protein M3Y94_00925100 [Aphelenchoides besseyi]|nr:hypothetical protein M3Y94_00925100 [Aphelenchoides besseyi]